MRDMYNGIKVVSAIAPQAVGTTGSGGGKTSGVIDRRGYESVTFAWQSGTTGTTGDTMTPKLTESDATGSGFTTVAAADLLGSVAAVALNTVKAEKLGYRGSKRYLKIQLFGIGTTTALVNAAAILGNPDVAPVA